MTPKEKFRIPRPSSERLAALGDLVDEIENLVHQRSTEVPQKLAELNSQLASPVEVSEICSYYGACSRDEFLASHLLPDPFQHENLTDAELLWLIGEMQKHSVDDDPLQQYYGTILDIIFPPTHPLLCYLSTACLVLLLVLCIIGAWFSMLLCFGRLYLGCPFCDLRSQVVGVSKKQLCLECPSCGPVCVIARAFRTATASKLDPET